MPEPAPTDVTHLLDRAADGDATAADELLPLVYDQLRRLAERHMVHEPRGHTLQPTALVHEAYLRLVSGGPTSWNGRGHFYGAAAEAMRRILIERARRVGRLKRGGGRARVSLDDAQPAIDPDEVDLLSLDEALTRLETEDTRCAQIVKLRFFAGLSIEDTALALDLSPRTVRRDWSFGRAWLYERMGDAGER